MSRRSASRDRGGGERAPSGIARWDRVRVRPDGSGARPGRAMRGPTGSAGSRGSTHPSDCRSDAGTSRGTGIAPQAQTGGRRTDRRNAAPCGCRCASTRRGARRWRRTTRSYPPSASRFPRSQVVPSPRLARVPERRRRNRPPTVRTCPTHEGWNVSPQVEIWRRRAPRSDASRAALRYRSRSLALQVWSSCPQPRQITHVHDAGRRRRPHRGSRAGCGSAKDTSAATSAMVNDCMPSEAASRSYSSRICPSTAKFSGWCCEKLCGCHHRWKM